ncbi:DedA family protein, partial [Fischerella thermalis WC441]
GTIVSLEQLVAWVSKFAIAALLILAAFIIIPLWLEARQANNPAGE